MTELLSPEIESRFTTKLNQHGRRMLEILAADCCERAMPDNPLRLAFYFKEMLTALEYTQNFITKYDAVMAKPIIDSEGRPTGYQRGVETSELMEGLVSY